MIEVLCIKNKKELYALAGVFFGLAGLLQLSRLTQGDPTVATGLELDMIAAVVIGGASLSGGTGSVFGSMIGALIMAVLRNGSNQSGWPTYMQEIIIGRAIAFLPTAREDARPTKTNTAANNNPHIFYRPASSLCHYAQPTVPVISPARSWRGRIPARAGFVGRV